jgi:hypothetical protein
MKMKKYIIEQYCCCRGELDLEDQYEIESENDIEYVLREVYIKCVREIILNMIEDREDVKGDWEEDLHYISDITFGREKGKYYVRLNEEVWVEVREIS